MSTQAKKYTENKSAKIFFSKFSDTVTFLPFIESFSMERDITTQETDTALGKSHKAQSIKKDVFNLSFNVPSENWEEAKENHRKFSLLIRMNLPDIGRLSADTTVESGVIVRFSNLIHEMSPDTSDTLENGVLCKISNMSYKPDLEFGFFDNGGMMFAKNFKISLQLSIAGGLPGTLKLNDATIKNNRKKVAKYSPGRMFGFETPYGDD